MQKFGMGQAVRRFEDERLIRGNGCYIDDIRLPNMAHAAFVRSPYAHARVMELDISAAQEAPGVIKVLTHADVIAAGLNPFPTITAVDGVDDNGISVPPRYALTGDEVKYVGDPIAMVVAETAAQARDAAEMVVADYDPHAAVTDLATVLDPDTSVIWPQIGENRAYHFHKGDEAATDAALAAAHHVTTLELRNNRLSPSAIEPRGAIGDYVADDEQYVLHVSGQAVFGQRGQMADVIFKVPPDKIRVIMPDVGGGFGAKNFVYPENVMVMLASKLCGRPVKWIADRSENFLCEIHGRDHLTRVDLGLDKDGKFVALKVQTKANMGAYLSSYSTIIPSSASWVALGGAYAIPAMSMTVDAVFTNTVPVDAYRGAGRPEAAYLLERTVDAAAQETGIDPAELRQRNYIRAFPHKTPLGIEIECGAFSENLTLASEQAEFSSFEDRVAASRSAGKLRGRGISSYLELTLGLPSDESEIRFDDDGGVTMIVGSASTGQGHETAYRQIINDELGFAPDKVRYVQGDTGKMASGGGHGGSRSLKIAGSALFNAAGEVREKGRVAAAFVLEANADEIEFNDGLFAVAGTNRRIDILELEDTLRNRDDLPDGVPSTLTTKGRFERQSHSFPNGVHIAEVEVDPDTGEITIERYTVVDDFGRIINPLIAEGQVAGGAVQGIGQAITEGVVYDEDGQLISGSFMDYAMPRADDVSAIDVTFNENQPTRTNPLGVKGAGEAGATGAPPAIVNAVVDALKTRGVRHIDMPLTPEKVWRAAAGKA
jgi:carbon-monoxide dehydrogenase large subunit